MLTDLLAAYGRKSASHSGEQHTQVIVYLCRRTDSAPWISSVHLLLDGDGRRKPLNEIRLRLMHLAKELTRICRQTLNIPALTLRIYGIESKR